MEKALLVVPVSVAAPGFPGWSPQLSTSVTPRARSCQRHHGASGSRKAAQVLPGPATARYHSQEETSEKTMLHMLKKRG